jgi:hypothetical protein
MIEMSLKKQNLENDLIKYNERQFELSNQRNNFILFYEANKVFITF